MRGPSFDSNEVQHEVERRRAARAGVAILVDREQLIAETHARELFAQRREILPMDRRLEIIEESGACERVAAGAQRAERHSPVGEPAQQRQKRRGHGITHIDAAAHEQNIDDAELIERRGRRELQARCSRARGIRRG